MPRYNYLHSSFQYGEISPKWLARTDTEQFQRGAKKIENMIALTSGGATRRPGTVYVDSITNGTTQNMSGLPADDQCVGGRLIPFIFSKTEAYLAWLYIDGFSGQLACRIYSPGGSSKATLVATAFGGSYYTLLSFANGWTQADLKNLHYVQIGDIIFFSSGINPPFMLSRTGTNTFTLTLKGVNPYLNSPAKHDILERPYRDKNISATTLTPSATTGLGITLTASVAMFNAGMAPASGVTHPTGTYFKITQGTNTAVVVVVGYTSTTVVTVDVLIDFSSTAASSNWQESSWSNYRGWPAKVGAYEGRLIYSSNTAEPTKTWCSLLNNVFHFMQDRLAQDSSSDSSGLNFFGNTVLETDPFSFAPIAREINRTTWIQSGKTLAVGTLGQEFVGTAGSDGRVLSALSISFQDQTAIGSNDTQAVRVNRSTVFSSRDGKELYQYNYDNLAGTFVADKLTAFSDHVSEQTWMDYLDSINIDPATTPLPTKLGKFDEICWQSGRNVVWAISEFNLIGITWDPSLKTLAPHRHIFGGSSNSGQPLVESMAVVPSSSGDDDNLYVLIQRQVNSKTVWFLELMGPDYKFNETIQGLSGIGTDDLFNPIFMDSCASHVSVSAATTHTGFSHLKGQTVAIIADGFVQPSVVVDNSGQVTIATAAKIVFAGLPYTPKLTLPPIDGGSAWGTAQGLMTRIDRVTVRFFRSLSVILQGPDSTSEPETLDMRPGDQAMGALIPYFTGDQEINMPMGPEKRCEITLYQNQPLPMTILGVVMRGQAYE